MDLDEQTQRDGDDAELVASAFDEVCRRSQSDHRLRLLIERVERLEAERKDIAENIRDVYAEAKAVGYDAKIMRDIVRLRKMRPDSRREMEMVLDTYKAALGLG